MTDLLVTGTWASFDSFLQLPHMPRTGETINMLSTAAEAESVFWGGCSYNAAISARAIGVSVGALTVEGRNFITSGYTEYLRENQIDISNVIMLDDDYSGHGYLLSDTEGNSIVLGALGSGLRQAQQEPKETAIKQARAVLAAPNFDLFTLKACQLARKHGALAAVNGPIAAWPDIAKAFAETIDILFCNHFELNDLVKLFGLENYGALFKMGMKALIVTMGAKGCRIITATDDTLVPPARSAGAVEPTGAGDAFAGATMAGILKGYSYDVAAQMGNTMGSFVVEKRGAQTNIPNWDTFLARYETFYGRLAPSYK